MHILTNCIVFSKLKLTASLLDQFQYLHLYVYKLCQLVTYVFAVAPIYCGRAKKDFCHLERSYLLLLCVIGYNVVKWSPCELKRDL